MGLTFCVSQCHWWLLLWSVRGLWHQGCLLFTPCNSEGTASVAEVLIPRIPQPARNAGTHSQTGSVSPPNVILLQVRLTCYWGVSLVPAARVIPALLAYIKVVAVKKLILASVSLVTPPLVSEGNLASELPVGDPSVFWRDCLSVVKVLIPRPPSQEGVQVLIPGQAVLNFIPGRQCSPPSQEEV